MMYRVGTPAMCYNNKGHGSRKGTSQERHDVRLSPCWQADMTLQLQSKINYDHTNRMQQRTSHNQSGFPHGRDRIAHLPACTSMKLPPAPQPLKEPNVPLLYS
ncbi:hypothetical protein AMECASPLE_025709 [Ameca splendens]|uniref:Uncharacterized protein n=1 Tax=Ameca splendens TaxID=208324 RepID=A0ABV0YRQ3_9TELE